MVPQAPPVRGEPHVIARPAMPDERLDQRNVAGSDVIFEKRPEMIAADCPGFNQRNIELGTRFCQSQRRQPARQPAANNNQVVLRGRHGPAVAPAARCA